MKFILLFTLVLSLNAFGHGDHGVPGAIPPAPNGGVLGEAEHAHAGSHDHDHMEASKREIFYEGTFKGDTIKIYPLELEPKHSKSFLVLKVSDFSKVSIVAMDARKKEKLEDKFTAADNSWEIAIKNKRARRVMLHISGIYKGAKYHGMVQVEKK